MPRGRTTTKKPTLAQDVARIDDKFDKLIEDKFDKLIKALVNANKFVIWFVKIVQIEYDPKLIRFRQLLDVFWSSHDSRQVFGQGPADVGNQYRSIIFTNGTEEVRLATTSKEREQTKSRTNIVTTQIQQLGTFYFAEPEHQKFELKRNPVFLQLIGNLPEEELERSSLAAKLNGYAAELCPPQTQKQFDAKIDEILKKGWPILREV
ncbi:hypothetical protein GIB67_009129 [Kingdonia uniflora]|uniref:peptide-methionine (S)-S-oxide reductase n=1 Tax=Kingdonia uniflora TaxID=39325 RepID=A0A7J7N2I9_9MAGN|nr:hypothetical protein GIB67_009129 [Kingdonia uniflora]